MFKGLRRKLERRRVKGLSKGLIVVDRLMVGGLDVQAIDQNYGKAEVTLRMMRDSRELTANEYGAAMVTLNNQYDKLRRKAKNMEVCL